MITNCAITFYYRYFSCVPLKHHTFVFVSEESLLFSVTRFARIRLLVCNLLCIQMGV